MEIFRFYFRVFQTVLDCNRQMQRRMEMINRDRERMVYLRQQYLKNIAVLESNPFMKNWQEHYDRTKRNLEIVTAKLARMRG